MKNLTCYHKAAYAGVIFLLITTPIMSSAQTKISTVADVSNCQYLDEVEGSSGYGKNMNWQNAARYSAISKAEELGASNIVLQQFQTITSLSGTVIAKAYSCHSES